MSAGNTNDRFDQGRRKLLKGAAAAAPLVVTFQGGRAWAVSSCSQGSNSVVGGGFTGQADDNSESVESGGFTGGLGTSCMASSGVNSSARLENLTKNLV